MANFISARGLSGQGSAASLISISPSYGDAAGGTSVTITGTGFVNGMTIKFDSSLASSIVVVDGTTITCVTPAHAAGYVNVSLWLGGTQIASLINAFAYTTSVFASMNYSNIIGAGAAALGYEDTAYPTVNPSFVAYTPLQGAGKQCLNASTMLRRRSASGGTIPNFTTLVAANVRVRCSPTKVGQNLEAMGDLLVFAQSNSDLSSLTPAQIGSISAANVISPIPYASFSATLVVPMLAGAVSYFNQSAVKKVYFLLASQTEYLGQGVGASLGAVGKQSQIVSSQIDALLPIVDRVEWIIIP